MKVKDYKKQSMSSIRKNYLGNAWIWWDLDIHIHYGAGAYICGEETALLEVVEGNKDNLG